MCMPSEGDTEAAGTTSDYAGGVIRLASIHKERTAITTTRLVTIQSQVSLLCSVGDDGTSTRNAWGKALTVNESPGRR